MSHAAGITKFSDDNIMYFEYDGTSDIALPRLFATGKALDENWRKQGNFKDPGCVHEPEDVILFTTYGGGFYWPGKACRKCSMIIAGSCTDEVFEQEKYGTPEWVPEEYL